MADEELLTTGELARKLSVSTQAITKWVREGKITPAWTTPGGHYRFRWESVAAELRADGAQQDD